MSCIEQPCLNSSWQWQCNIHLVGLSHTKERNSPLLFYLEKWRFLFSCPTRSILRNGMEWNGTEILRVWKRTSSRAQTAMALPPALLFSKEEGETSSRSVRWEGGSKEMFITGHSLNTLFPPGTRWPARSSNSFRCDSSCGSRSCSLKKDTSLFSLFLVFPVLTS